MSNRKGVYYLVDGRYVKSLGTTVKRFAEHRLEQYIKGKFGFGRGITLGEYYEGWIEGKTEPIARRSAVRDYRQHFCAYIKPALGGVALGSVDRQAVERLRNKMVATGLSIKTARNVIDGTLRALWRDATAEGLVQHNPFAGMRWPAPARRLPEPFTVGERGAILGYMLERQAFYYPFVLFQFATGARPSESTGLRWSDVDTARGTVAIQRSRHLHADNQTKTAASWRVIQVPAELIAVIEQLRLPWRKPSDPVFFNKVSGAQLDANEWARVYWQRVCEGAGVRQRKFYATRHTSITEAVQRGDNMLAIARYHGTSLAMIERNYCGALSMDANKMQTAASNYAETLVVPTGIEPASASCDNVRQLIYQAVRSSPAMRKVG